MKEKDKREKDKEEEDDLEWENDWKDCNKEIEPLWECDF
jgi:hypothetical protein